MRECTITLERVDRGYAERKQVLGRAYSGAPGGRLELQTHGRYEVYRATGKSWS